MLILSGLAVLLVLSAIIYRKLAEIREQLIYLMADYLAIRDEMHHQLYSVLGALERRGIVSREELERSVPLSGGTTISKEDMDRLDAILGRDPDTYSEEDIKFLRRMGINLIRSRNKKAVKLGHKLLVLAAKSEYYTAMSGRLARAERLEANYRRDLCMAEVKLYRGGSVEYVEEPDVDCIMERVNSVRDFAAGKTGFPEEAARMYRECKYQSNASCRMFMEMLRDDEKRLLELGPSR